MAKFAANNNESASTKFFLYIIFKGLYLYMNFDIVDLSNISTYKWISK